MAMTAVEKWRASAKGAAWREKYRASGAERERSRKLRSTEEGRLASLAAGRKYRGTLKYRATLARRQKTPQHRAQQFRARNKCCYGLLPGKYSTLLTDQRGVCAICGGVNANGRRLSVDHDHATSRVRALLCGACNAALGHAKENILLLYKMADYLEMHGRIPCLPS